VDAAVAADATDKIPLGRFIHHLASPLPGLIGRGNDRQ